MKRFLTLLFMAAWCFAAADSPKLAGKWQLSMDTPHGVIKGPFQIEQSGAKLTATFQTEMFGSMAAAGSLDGASVSFHLTVPGPHELGFSGTVDGSKMSGKTELGGEWSATRETTVMGRVTDFRVKSLELAVKPDSGAPVWVKFSADTEVVKVAPGEHDLTRAQPAKITDIAREDRVLISFVGGMEEARRIVVISETAIERRAAAESLDWANRGISGVVTARDGSRITLETRTPQGAQHTTIVVTAKTSIRRYAPDSVKFADAVPARVDEIAPGDQLRTRGDRSPDGDRFTADDVVFGTFLTTLGSVSAVSREGREITIVDAVSKRPLTVRLTADTRFKKMPDMHEMPAGHGSGDAPVNISQILESLPSASLDDLKVGATVVVTSTRGARPDRVTGIMVIANVDALLQMAQSQAPGANPMDALNRMHGGMLGGPGGVSLPAILQ